MFKVTINLSKNDVKKLSNFVGYPIDSESDAKMAIQEFLTETLLNKDLGQSEVNNDE